MASPNLITQLFTCDANDTMSYKDHEKLSEEDFRCFDQFLTEHYQQPLAEGYERLRGAIRKRLEGTDTNRRYRPRMMSDIDDLISTVIFRLASINGKLQRKGEQIRDLDLMLKKIVVFVHREELRRLRWPSAPLGAGGSDASDPLPLPQPVDDEVSAAERQIWHDCYVECLDGLPEKIKTLFLRYYPDLHVEPKELGALRRRLAGEEAGDEEEDGKRRSQEPSGRELNNLQSKVNKWRSGRLEDCMRRCAAVRRSRHVELEYLRQQRGGK